MGIALRLLYSTISELISILTFQACCEKERRTMQELAVKILPALVALLLPKTSYALDLGKCL